MNAQHFDHAVKQPATLRILIPTWNVPEEEWQATYPSPPPPTPTPLRPSRETSFDAQRYDPFRTMLAATSPPRYSSPTATEFAIEYPELHLDALMRHFPPEHDFEVFPSRNSQFKSAFAHQLLDDEDSDSSGSDVTTPAEENLVLNDVRTTYRFAGAEDEGECAIDRTIVRPLAPPRKFDLTRTIASATLRTMSSFSSLKAARSGEYTPSESRQSLSLNSLSAETKSGVIPPPVSRRPSMGFAPPEPASPVLLSSSVAMQEVAERLRRFALGLGCASSGVARNFEEAIDHYEKAWPREASGEGFMEVHVTRTITEKTIDTHPNAPSPFPSEFGLRHMRSGGIGLYASSRSRKTISR